MKISRALLALGFVAVAACALPFDLDDRPCPCSEGWVCCPSGNVCAAVASSCPGGSDKVAGDDDAVVAPGRVHLSGADQVGCLTFDGDAVYWSNGDVYGSPTSPTGPGPNHAVQVPIASGRKPSCGIAVHGGGLFATVFGLGKIARIDIAGGVPSLAGVTPLLYGALVAPSSLVVDDAYVYVTELDTGLVKRFGQEGERDGGAPDAAAGDQTPGVVLGQGGRGAQGLVADAQSLYWLDEGGLRKMSKEGGSIATLWTTTLGEAPHDLVLAGGMLTWLVGKSAYGLELAGGVAVKLVLTHTVPASTATAEAPAPERICTPGADVFCRCGVNCETSKCAEAIKTSEGTKHCTDDGRSFGPCICDSNDGVLEVDALTTDGRNVIFASEDYIWTAGLAGGTATPLLRYRSGQPATGATALAVDATHFVWASDDGVWSHPR